MRCVPPNRRHSMSSKFWHPLKLAMLVLTLLVLSLLLLLLLLSLASVVQSLELESRCTPSRQHTPATPTCVLFDHTPVTSSAIMVMMSAQKHNRPTSTVLVSARRTPAPPRSVSAMVRV